MLKRDKEDTLIDKKIRRFFLLEKINRIILSILIFGVVVSIVGMFYFKNNNYEYFNLFGILALVLFFFSFLFGCISYFRRRVCPRCKISMVRKVENDFVIIKCENCGLSFNTHITTWN